MNALAAGLRADANFICAASEDKIYVWIAASGVVRLPTRRANVRT